MIPPSASTPVAGVDDAAPWRPLVNHAAIVLAFFTILFAWLYGRPFLEHRLVAESDIYEQFLPMFLSPITIWSSYEYSGTPAFADPQDSPFYPLHFFFARVVGSWNAFVISAFVLAACFTYAYVYSLTRSRRAALFAGLAFGLSEAVMERVGHLPTLHATAWLPLILLCIDRLRGGNPRAWVALGAIAAAMATLGGHPQLVLYEVYLCGLYAFAGGLFERAQPRYYLRLAAMVTLGVLLAAVKVLPILETSGLTARQTLSFDAFVSHANTPEQMLSALFPAIIHDGREAPTFVGLSTLVFATAAGARLLRDWRVAFWACIAVATFLLGTGASTPMAQMAYQLPLYDKFRVEARHLILGAFALTALAGFGLAAVQRQDVPRRAVYLASALLLSSMAGGLAVLAAFPQAFELDHRRHLPWTLPIWSGAIWISVVLGLCAAVACAGVARHPRSRRWTLALALALAIDLVLALPYNITVSGLEVPSIPAAAGGPSVHAERLAAGLAPAHQRLLSPAGTNVDAVVPAVFARTWQIPIAGGYGAMLLARYNSLAMIGTNGSIDPLALTDGNTALDLLAVKYVAVRAADLVPSQTTVRGDIEWASSAMELPIGVPRCGQNDGGTASYAIPPSVPIVGIAIVARMRCAEDVVHGTEVARLRVSGPGGFVFERPLLAGIDVAEAGLANPSLQRRARHAPARVFDATSSQWSYLVRLDLPASVQGMTLRVDSAPTSGWLEIERLSIVASDGRSLPLTTPGILFNVDRWREIERFATSRVTDRGSDEAADGEEEYVVFENRRALPRAWIADEVIALNDREMLTAIHYSRLPDGRRFDPGRMALVESPQEPQRHSTGPSTALIRSLRDGAFTIDVTSAGGGFLVLSESFYPGWRAHIDDRVLPVHRTNVSLQGVFVPPGHHVVVFELVSNTLRPGAVVTVLAAVALVVLVGGPVWRSQRRSRTTETQRHRGLLSNS